MLQLGLVYVAALGLTPQRPLAFAITAAVPTTRSTPVLCKASSSSPLLSPGAVAGLAAFGATAGPLVDAVHNQALLAYDVLPITLGLVNAKTSLLIPPLLALTYALLGTGLVALSERLVGSGRVLPLASDSLSLQQRALLAVGSTIAIIKLSELLTLSGGSVAVLFVLCFLQWATLDASWASLLLACVVAVGGPLAELPFLYAQCWHYTAPDYFPLMAIDPAFGPGSWAGLNYVTAPCYFAVTTDAIALGRWLASRGTDDG